nr:hypothetical protein CFP56_22187 [Quercus suber]
MPVVPRLAHLAAFIGPVTAAMGNAFSTGPTAHGNFITYASATLVVPHSPAPQVGLLSLWTGMGMSNGDLVQALVESYSGDAYLSTRRSVYESLLHNLATILTSKSSRPDGRRPKASSGGRSCHPDIFWTATGGKALGFGTAEECQPDYPCGIVPAHGTLTSTDGKVWHGDRIHIDEVDFNYAIPKQTPICPTSEGTTYTTPEGKIYDIKCDVDYDKHDIKVVQVETQRIADCLVVCEQMSKCVGAVMLGPTCHLKSSKGKVLAKRGRQAAMLQGI